MRHSEAIRQSADELSLLWIVVMVFAFAFGIAFGIRWTSVSPDFDRQQACISAQLDAEGSMTMAEYRQAIERCRVID